MAWGPSYYDPIERYSTREPSGSTFRGYADLPEVVFRFKKLNQEIRPSDPFLHQEAEDAKATFHDEYGDHLTLLNVYSSWRNQGKSESWAKEHFVHHKELERASDIRNQLVALMNFHGVPVVSAGT